MLFLLKFVAIAALSYLAQLILPWWSTAVAAFMISMIIPTRSAASFLSGFLGVGLYWLAYAWAVDIETGSIISLRVAPILGLDRPASVLLLTAFVGAIVGGMGALSGDLLQKFIKGQRDKAYY